MAHDRFLGGGGTTASYPIQLTISRYIGQFWGLDSLGLVSLGLVSLGLVSWLVGLGFISCRLLKPSSRQDFGIFTIDQQEVGAVGLMA